MFIRNFRNLNHLCYLPSENTQYDIFCFADLKIWSFNQTKTTYLSSMTLKSVAFFVLVVSICNSSSPPGRTTLGPYANTVFMNGEYCWSAYNLNVHLFLQNMVYVLDRCTGFCNKEFCKIIMSCRPFNRTSKYKTLDVYMNDGVVIDAPIIVCDVFTNLIDSNGIINNSRLK